VSAVPARPAAYIRVEDATTADDPGMIMQRNLVIGRARDLGWPVPALYADAGQPGSRYAALVEAIAAGRHDAVIVDCPGVIGHDLGQIEAFDRHCRQHGACLCGHYGWPVAGDTRALFGVIRDIREFTITGEHLRLLRRAYVTWQDAESGAPSIDPKRPYGNSGVYRDIAEILGVPRSEWVNEELGPLPDAAWRFVRLHVETGIALQIALATGEFHTGRYVRDQETVSTCRWRRADA
jgi:hypothetical protein